MTSRSQKLLVLIALGVLASGLEAQDTVRRDSTLRVLEEKRLAFTVNRGEVDPAHAFDQYLFPPELVMRHQARLKITEAQRNLIVAEITKLQATAIQVQWRVGDEAEKLTEMLQRETVAEADVLAQAERMIMHETAVKRAQLAMLIRIRNTLTPEQRAMLQEARRGRRE